ncbi:SHC binding and spindle associated nessun dorma [Oratosquilla oratoria]|uniref:SHC binding and spindle associated nessun dorma n=1 Tax=Oratosquilla oratoria TaxID=337810 RepID=UPI003F75CEB1
MDETLTEVSRDNSVIEVYKVSWLPEDHIAELTSILEGVSVDSLEEKYIEYIEQNIEPAGWEAIWKASIHSAQDSLGVGRAFNVLVYVANVSRESLMADVVIKEFFDSSFTESEKADMESHIDKEVSVPLTQLYPLAEQENHVLDMETTAELVGQLRFFYSYIWRPWDALEDQCNYDNYTLTQRINLYYDTKNGAIPSHVSAEMWQIIRKAKEIGKQIQTVELASGVESDVKDVSENFVRELIQLHKQMNQLKDRFEILADPVTRYLSAHEPLMKPEGGAKGKVKVVMDCVKVEDMLLISSRLPEFLQNIPQVPEGAQVQGFPTLQHAIDASCKDDVVVLMSGTHKLQNLGNMSQGGTFIGMGEDVVLMGSIENGDVMLDLIGKEFYFYNLTLRPTQDQVGLILHQGSVQLKNCLLEGGKGGIVLLGDSQAEITGCTIKLCKCGFDARGKSQAKLSQTNILSCSSALTVEEYTQIKLELCSFSVNSKHAICFMQNQDADTSNFSTIPDQELLKCLLKECEDVKFDGNAVNVAFVIADSQSDNSADSQD